MSDSSDKEDALSTSSDENLDHEDNLDLTANTIKNYNVICELGRGSFSIVWLAYSIVDGKFYALKVQNPAEFKDGMAEIKFVKKLPTQPPVFNNLVEHFIEIENNNKYLCSVWHLHCANIDSLMRKGDYTDGFDLVIVKKIMKQLIESIKILHKKFKVFHGDIKSDNILVKGMNAKNEFIIKRYLEENFYNKYVKAKEDFWTNKGNNITSTDKMPKEDKLSIRKTVHQQITEDILEEYHQSVIYSHTINDNYISDIKISLGDFGTHCEEHNYYEESFGTRYYQAPEIILMGKCSLPVDIWALGCTFYELLSGNILFDPIKDSKYSRDYYHLCLINDTCGPFNKNFIKKTKHYKKYFNSNGEIIDHQTSDESRLDRKLNELTLCQSDKLVIKELLKSMLTINPSERCTIDEISRHEFFT
jgi:serine/threonine-protein kinase SRPK3